MARYYYSLVEGTYVVRQSRSKGGAECMTPEGEWVDFPDLWDVTMNGRPIASEEEALETAFCEEAAEPPAEAVTKYAKLVDCVDGVVD